MNTTIKRLAIIGAVVFVALKVLRPLYTSWLTGALLLVGLALALESDSPAGVLVLLCGVPWLIARSIWATHRTIDRS